MKIILKYSNPSFFLLLIFLTGCKGGNENHKSLTDKPGEKVVRCYENVYTAQDSSGFEDKEVLVISIDGENVIGNYDWLPAQKDSRKGELKGKLIQGKIRAMYVFMQEGIKDSCEITILLKDGKAEITGGKPELGLQASIKETGCQ